MPKTRQVLLEQEDDDASDGAADDKAVSSRTIRYLNVFRNFLSVELTIDSGSAGNMMRASCASRLGITIIRSMQSIHLANDSSSLNVLAKTQMFFQVCSGDDVCCYSSDPMATERDAHVLSTLFESTVWPGEYIGAEFATRLM